MTLIIDTKGWSRVTIDDLTNTTPPARVLGPQHTPVPHRAFVETILRSLDKMKLDYELDLALKTEPVEKKDLVVETPDLIGELKVNGTTYINGLAQGRMLAFRNSHVMRAAASIVAGAKVFICSNMAMVGTQNLLHRRHTHRVDILGEVQEALPRAVESWEWNEKNQEFLSLVQLRDVEEAEALSFRLLRRGALPPNTLKRGFELWRDGKTPDVQGASYWSLLQGFTRALNRLNPADQHRYAPSVGFWTLDEARRKTREGRS